MANCNKTRLSKSTLEMKFMKRTKEKVEKEIYDEEGEEYFSNQLTSSLKKQTGQFIIEPSFIFVEQLIEGRLSFQGMNPEIERLMELEEQEKVSNSKKEEADISDNEMMDKFHKSKKMKINHYDMKFSNKKWSRNNERDSPPKKPKFLKPKE